MEITGHIKTSLTTYESARCQHKQTGDFDAYKQLLV